MEKIALIVGEGSQRVNIQPVAGMPSGGLINLIPTVITYLFIGATFLSLAFLIIGGIRWITSGGDKHGVETARKTVIFAVIGLAVVFSSFLIINTVGRLFSVSLLPK